MEESTLVSVQDLSFVGLLRRLEHIDRLKEDVRHPSAEQVATIESEPIVKKMVQEQLQSLSSTKMTKDEKSSAKSFLDAQLKAVAKDAHAPGADKRKAKLSELQAAVLAADTAEDPAHIAKARAEVPRADKGYAEIHKQYEMWEKGKKMLAVDALNVLKRTHEEGQARLAAAKEFVQTQLERRPDTAAGLPKVLAAKSTASAVGGAGRGKAAAKSSSSSSNVRGGGPATRTSGTVGNSWGSGPGGRPPCAPTGSGYPSTAAFLQAEAAAAMRQEAAEREAQEARARDAPPKERKQPTRPKVAEEGPVLSYACTVAAVSEHLGVREDDARQMAGSSADFRQHFDPQTWENIANRSVEIEKEKRDAVREKEKHKAATALARATDKLPMPAGVQASKAAAKPSGGGGSVANRAAAPDAKSKAKAKAQGSQGAPKKPGPKNGSLATKNGFAAFSESDEEDDGFTKVRR